MAYNNIYYYSYYCYFIILLETKMNALYIISIMLNSIAVCLLATNRKKK